MKFIKLFISCIFLFSGYNFSEEITAKITIDTNKVLNGKISREHFGSFIEFVNGFINSQFGLSAQELMDRGFDGGSCNGNWGVPCFWNKFSDVQNEAEWGMDDGGYNTRGRYMQRITKFKDTLRAGVFQTIYLNDRVGNNFYIYFKGDSSIKNLYLAITDFDNQKIHYQTIIGKPEKDWKKFEIFIPILDGVNKANLLIYGEGIGSYFLDESSLMPIDNKYTIKKEYYDFYKSWKPGLLRYPGGWIADHPIMYWKNGIGDIDQRTSPLVDNFPFNQRIDFGTNEYLKFCNDIGITPQMTANLGTGTSKDASEWFQYIYGDENNEFGKMRIANGLKEPTKVGFWEIGNEQYGDWAIGKLSKSEMANKYLTFYDALKKIDPSTQIIIDGSFWGSFAYFDTVMTIVGKKCDIYGWHFDTHVKPSINYGIKEEFLSRMGTSKLFENYLISCFGWLKDKKLFPNVKQGITEYYPVYSEEYNWSTHPRLFSLESGLWTALNIMATLRNPESFVFSERTHNSGMFFIGEDPVTNKRVIGPSPTFLILNLMSNNFGDKSITFNINCPEYNVPPIEGLWINKNIKWLDAAITATNDSIYIYLVNRHPESSINLSFENYKFLGNSKIYSISSNNWLDSNSVYEPNKIKPVISTTQLNNSIILPKHSFTLIATSRKRPSNIEINEKDKEINAYYSLTNDEIIIEFKNGNPEISTFKVTDINGRLIKTGDFIESNFISCFNIPSGSYLITIYESGHIATKLLNIIK